MRLLLDTHIAIWALLRDRRLSERASTLIADEANDVFVSAVTVWEIAIKHSSGRGHVPFAPHEALLHFRAAGFQLLEIRAEHAAAVADLPPIHGDPFDRLLVAQAQTVPLRLLTHDANIAKYGSIVLLV